MAFEPAEDTDVRFAKPCILSSILMASHLKTDKDTRRLVAIAVVAASYGGDMDEDLCNELLDDIDYYFNKVKCRAI